MNHGRLASAMVIAVLLAGGCASGRNARLVVGPEPTPTFRDPDASPTMRADTARPRGAWEVTQVLSPIDGVVHGAVRWRDRPVGRKSDAWTAGTFPVAGETREPVGDSPLAAVFGLGRAVGDVVWGPLRALSTHPRERWSPRTVWKRTPGGRARTGTIGPRPANDEL